MLGGESCQPRILYPAKLPFKNEGERTFSDRQKLKKFVVSRPGLQEMLKKALLQEGSSET